MFDEGFIMAITRMIDKNEAIVIDNETRKIKYKMVYCINWW